MPYPKDAATPVTCPIEPLNSLVNEVAPKIQSVDIKEFEAQKRTGVIHPPRLVSVHADGAPDNDPACALQSDDRLDLIIVGAGFSGISAIYRARKLGLRAKIFEAGLDFGGVWYWNRYPGARVDSEFPFYQLNIPEAYKSFDFTQRFPDHKELRRYMNHLDNVLELRKDVFFGAEVRGAEYDQDQGVWTIVTTKGLKATAKYLVLATGLLHRKYCPDFPSFAKYKGEVYHSSSWPDDENLTKKRVAVIGAGATSVQIVQELAKQTADGGSLTIYIRRPSTCIPMRQRDISPEEQESLRAYYPVLFKEGRQSRGGIPISSVGCNVFEHTVEQRERLFEELWARGAFNFLLGTYRDIAIDEEANREIYNFWAKKVRLRMKDPLKKDLMAPLKPLYPFGTKRPPLERDYYECVDMKHVQIVDLKKDPIKAFTEHGIATESDLVEKQFDVVVLATGFDSFTGSLTHMGLKNKHGVDIKDIWKEGVRTYLGILMNGFPNAFVLYSPQAPTAFSNGPTIIESQCDFIFDIIKKLEKENAKSIEPTTLAEDEWKALITDMTAGSLLKGTDSWWNGGNIPGKKIEVLTYGGGISEYEKTCYTKLDGWKGFVIETNRQTS
ncbi:hypothetical protein COCCADRAFT_10211 [Bipolaris zeicola 26-R-13]|uniref:FAD/NAD(P)-binding domain-containing protein n=1 Tax=Cochliobolus carbonum (strain 26-R-13) TaxID=930089 RepID=W6XWD9_COCC2|nr:uncharacterized protein COCCADRAFT_10211 [Bipolaris zeicola 26-R-13]EUC27099.1 hypothetical protein COCCADRAFT_10211 [Bipolaris zeicola 26-R-13]